MTGATIAGAATTETGTVVSAVPAAAAVTAVSGATACLTSALGKASTHHGEGVIGAAARTFFALTGARTTSDQS